MAIQPSLADLLTRRDPAVGADAPQGAPQDSAGNDMANSSPSPAGPSLWHRLLGPYRVSPVHWADREIFLTVMTLCALVLLGVYHPHWVRGGDSEAYLGIARELVKGNGYTYNGQPVGLVPPGWPIVLAAAMWFTSLFSVLKLLLVGSMLVFLGCSFWVMRRLAGPWWCAATVVALAFLQPTVQLSMWFHSDAIFLAASWAGLLLALQAGERYGGVGIGRVPWGRICGALLLLAFAISIRWPGVLWWPVIALAFVQGRPLATLAPDRRTATITLRPKRFDAMWISAIAAMVIAIVTFFALRALVRVDPADLDPRYSTFISGGYDLVNQYNRPTIATHIERLLRTPEWISVLFWNIAGRTQPYSYALFYVAAACTIPLAVAFCTGLARRQWIWLGAVVAWLPIVATWPHAIDRYSMPVAPLLILGTLIGTAQLSRYLRSRPKVALPALALLPLLAAPAGWLIAPNYHGLLTGLTILSLAVIALYVWRRKDRLPSYEGKWLPWILIAPAIVIYCLYNGVLYGIEVWVARGDVYARYEGGVQPSLNQIGYYLRVNSAVPPGADPEDGRSGELAVTVIRPNYDHHLKTLGPRRNASWVADMPGVDVPPELSTGPTDVLVEWLEQHDVQWYIWLPPQKRFLHFRGTPWRDEPDLAWMDMDWRLYRIEDGLAWYVDVSDQPHEVLVVPGLEDVRDLGDLRNKLPLPYN